MYESWSLIDSTDFAHASSSSQNQQREDWEWALGIALCLAGAACTNLGLTVQKYSFILNDRLALNEQKPAMNQVWWLIGMSVFMVGQVLNLIAFGYTSQALAAVLGSFSLVTNGIFAPLILKEKLTKTIIFSIAVIVSGSILVVLASSHATQDYTLDELISLYKRDLFIGYMTVLTISMIACLIIMFREDREWEKQKEALEAWEQQREVAGLEYDDSIPSPVSVGTAGSLQQDPEMAGKGSEIRTVPQSRSSLDSNSSETAALIGVKVDSPPPELKVITPSPLTPIVAGAILSSCSVLFGKCTVQLLKASFYDSNQFVYPLSWFLTAIFLTCAIMAVVYLNIGMRRGTALFVVPLYYVLNTVLAILGGLIYFEEFQHFSKVQGFLFGIGVIVTVVGVWVGSRGQVGDDAPVEEELDIVASEATTSASPGSSESPPSAGAPAVTAGTMPAKSALSSSSTPSVASADSSDWVDDSFHINTVIPAAGASKSAVAASSSSTTTKPVRKKSVRFGAGDENEDGEEASLIGSSTSRLVRANSAPDQGAITDEEFRAMLREEPRASLAYDNTLSTPQPNTRYGSVASSHEAVQSRTPGAPAAAAVRRGALDEETRRRVWERLTPAQKETLRQRDAALAAADGRRRKYSYSRAAYRGSFRQSGDEHKSGERRYSVAFIGLGVS